MIYYWTDVWQLGIYLLKIYIAAKQLYWRLWDGERPCTHRNISSWSVRHSANDRGSVHNKEWTKRKIVRLYLKNKMLIEGPKMYLQGEICNTALSEVNLKFTETNECHKEHVSFEFLTVLMKFLWVYCMLLAFWLTLIQLKIFTCIWTKMALFTIWITGQQTRLTFCRYSSAVKKKSF